MKLKKITKIYLLLWVAVIVSFVFLIVAGRTDLFAPHHRLAQDPANVERITGLNLPDTRLVNSWNNLERWSSRWDCFSHRSHFAEQLSDDCIRQLETLCKTDSVYWHKDEKAGCYEYLDDAWDRGDIYCISCRIDEDYAYVEYYVDEYEELDNVFIGFLIILLLVLVLVVWGMVLLVVIIIRKCRKQKSNCEPINENC